MLREEFTASDLFNVASVACISARRKLLYTANPLQAWPLVEGVQVPRFQPLSRPIQCISTSTDERTVAVALGSVVKIFDAESGRELRTFAEHADTVNAVAPFNKNVYYWATVADDGLCILWDIQAHPPYLLKKRIQSAGRSVALSPDDRLCIVGSDVSIEIFDLRQRAIRVKLIAGISVRGIAFHPHEFLLSSFGSDRVVRFWDLETYECIGVSDMTDTDINNVSFAPNGDLLVACTDETLHLVTWEPVTEVAKSELPLNTKALCLLPTSDSLEVLCAFGDRSIVLFSSTYEEILATADIEPVEDVDPFGRPESLGNSPVTDGSDGAHDSPLSDEPSSPDEEHEPTPIPEQLDPETSPYRNRRYTKLPETPTRRPPLGAKAGVSRLSSSSSTSKSTSSLASVERPGVQKRSSTPETPSSPTKTMGSRPSTIKKAPSLNPDMRPRNSSMGRLEVEKPKTLPTTQARPDRTMGKSPAKSPGPPKDMRRANSLKNGPRQAKPPETLGEACTMASTGHSTFTSRLEERRQGFASVSALVRSRGLLGAVDVLDGNKKELALLCEAVAAGSQMSFPLAMKLLPRIRILWSAIGVSKPGILSLLAKIVFDLGHQLKINARGPASSIGVDVAAEERRAKALKCVEALAEIQLNEPFYRESLKGENRALFDRVMKEIAGICA